MSLTALTSSAVVFEAPQRVALATLDLTVPAQADVVVAITYSGISTGTERLLWSGQMPMFRVWGIPSCRGMSRWASSPRRAASPGRAVGDHVFVPGASCYGEVRGLFGGASSHIVLPGARTTRSPEALGANGVLLALAATAYHAAHPFHAGTPGNGAASQQPDLIVGHGVLGRLMARLALADGAAPPTVWETNSLRTAGATGYAVVHPDADTTRDYGRIFDCSGDPAVLDALIARLAPGGEIVLAGFYTTPLSFAFAPAFMREVRLRVAAQWKPGDLAAVTALVATGALDLDGLVTHTATTTTGDDVRTAYETAFTDARCLKMILDWRRPS